MQLQLAELVQFLADLPLALGLGQAAKGPALRAARLAYFRNKRLAAWFELRHDNLVWCLRTLRGVVARGHLRRMLLGELLARPLQRGRTLLLLCDEDWVQVKDA